MDLILWRHADAREAEDELADLDRPLTPKGERQAQRMAHWLHRHIPDSTRILVSPALRARQTADALNRKYKLASELAPERTVTELLAAVRWPEARQPVLVVGHQPTLGLAMAYLLAALPQPWAFRKGAVCWLRCREREGQEGVVLHAMVAPDLL
ncbi:MAG: phosphohistidine phosphatase SixA [Rubrivivax sp.]|nr:phosphohistidine phosphatase SixA [Rubrivivax sp.]